MMAEALKKIQTIGSIISEFGFTDLKNRTNIIEKLTENHTLLDVAVLGQFKAGKSTLVNSLINSNLLPSGAVPVTSVITRIFFGPTEKASIIYTDNRISESPVPKLDEFITELKNPGNEKAVSRVDIETPALADAKGIRFIDTPGLGSVYRASTDVTLNWIPESGVVMVLISATQPGSDADISLIRETLMHSPYVIIVLSKVDLLSDEQLKEIKEFLHRSLRDEFGREFRIFEFSAFRDAGRFRHLLWEEGLLPLLKNTGTIRADILDHKLSSLLDHTLGYLRIAEAVSMQKENTRKEFRDYILDELTRENIIRTDLKLISNHYKSQTRTTLEDKIYHKYLKTISSTLESYFLTRFGSWKGNILQYTQNYESWVKEALAHALIEALAEELTGTRSMLKNSQVHFSSYMKSFHENLDSKMKEVFNLPLPEPEWDVVLPEISKPDIFVRPAFDIHIDMLGPLFPMLLFRKWLKRYFFNQISSEVEINLSRLVTDLTDNVNTAIDGLEKQTFSFIHSEILTVEKLLSDNMPDTRKISSSMQLLETMKST